MSSSTSNRRSLIVRLQFSNEQANRIRQIASRSRNSAAESNQPACAAWTGKKIDDELRCVRSLLFDIEQDLWRRGQRLTGCVADHAQRKQRNAVHGTCLRAQLRLHIHHVRAGVPREIIAASISTAPSPLSRAISSRSAIESTIDVEVKSRPTHGCWLLKARSARKSKCRSEKFSERSKSPTFQSSRTAPAKPLLIKIFGRAARRKLSILLAQALAPTPV